MQANNIRRGVSLAAVAVALAAAGLQSRAASPSPQPAATAVATTDFSAIVERNGPAVVNISVTAGSRAASRLQRLPPVDPDDPFYELFRRFGIPIPEDRAPTHSLGSGFIISSDGLVMTSAHVIDDADEVVVKLADRREFKAKVLGADRLSDVAVLHIEAQDLPVVRFGDPAKTLVGDWVLAIGSPFGFDSSVTAGIISAKGRSLPDDGYVPFLQTDAAVNPGSSGGPLFNLAGEVIGINAQIMSRSGGNQGVSFAIPIDVALRIQRELVRHGKVAHGRLGVAIQEMSQALAQSFGLENAAGALVSGVEEDSPADRAGLETGDIILKIGGKDVRRSADLPPLVAELKPGSRVALDLWRKGRNKTVVVTVGELVEAKAAPSESGEIDEGGFSLTVRTLTPEEREQAGVPAGVMIENASEPALRAGIRRGDIILSVNGEPVTSAGHLRSLMGKPGKQVAVLIQRNGDKMFVPMTPG